MKTLKSVSALAAVFLAFTLLISSCAKDDDYEYFIGASQVVSYSSAAIETMMGLAVQAWPDLQDLDPYIDDGVRVYRLEYRTILKGKNIEASGLVSIPATPGNYPVISFQNGTNTLNSNCPSENPTDYFYQLVEFVASMGFIVVIPDYIGFGSSADMPHPYLLKVPTIESVCMMLQAVAEATGEFGDVSVKNEYYLIGYSEGGLATFNSHCELESDHAHYGLNLKGSACGAGPYDLEQMMVDMRTAVSYPVPAYIGYIINAWTYYDYIENSVPELLKEPYATRLATLFDGNHSISEINAQLTTSIPDLLTDEFRNNGSSQAFESVTFSMGWNSAMAYKSEIPLLFVHGDADTQVDVSNTESLYDLMILQGTSSDICTKKLLPGLDHGEAVVPFMIEGLKFILNLRDV
ncbi:MAG TPA: alpha/beta hydrolase [Bacteroidales bacterium]|nr:alpha/beta hydrolase [Bacteroidales bacterium]HPF03664.1 alpha/beta hydrolase [Bacteroidales bacterium]HPJ60641.1 alpha/beta hydrolase [Bacteroidales bacterium]HPR13558.1 alpha/beta hydrolase [Bacteroidales bacterium]HRW84340.1 alpha/beta hydrolase [Bacteroidales bacterium]